MPSAANQHASWWWLIRCCWTSRMEQSANPAVRVGHYTRTVSASTQNISVWSLTVAATSDSVFHALHTNSLTYLLTYLLNFVNIPDSGSRLDSFFGGLQSLSGVVCIAMKVGEWEDDWGEHIEESQREAPAWQRCHRGRQLHHRILPPGTRHVFTCVCIVVRASGLIKAYCFGVEDWVYPARRCDLMTLQIDAAIHGQRLLNWYWTGRSGEELLSSWMNELSPL